MELPQKGQRGNGATPTGQRGGGTGQCDIGAMVEDSGATPRGQQGNGANQKGQQGSGATPKGQQGSGTTHTGTMYSYNLTSFVMVGFA